MMIFIFKNLRNELVILKPDKGNGIVLIKSTDYFNSLEKLFSDKTKFKKIKEDPTPARLTSIQRYLKQLNKRGELSDSIFKEIRPQNAKLARAHGLPKIHKTFETIPSFRPIVDTTGTTHYSVGKYLSNLLNPLTHNEYTLKDSFDAVERINAIPPELRSNSEYMFVSLDVVSLFTNVPLKKTVNIILKRIYQDKLINTTLSKRSLKKLILDTCKKTAFSSNNKIYEQIDGVSMGGSLGPVLANIIMTELEKTVVDNLVQTGVIKFYVRYVDDTLLLIKKNDIGIILQHFNNFDKNLKFTIDTFSDCVPHFLDIEIYPDGLGIFHKSTQTGQYVNINSFTLWKWKISWMRSLINRAKRICSENRIKTELNRIKDFAAWNGYPKNIVNSIIKQTLKHNNTSRTQVENNPDVVKIYLDLKFCGEIGDQLIKKCFKKLYHCFQKDKQVKFVLNYQTTKMSFYTNTKDKVPLLSQSFVVYKFKCPGCNCSYIGKTERTLFERTREHAYENNNKDQSAIYEHIRSCPCYNHIIDMFNILDNNVNYKTFNISQIRDNTTILERADNWNILLFKEALMIKRHKPSLNCGLKASKELQLF